MENRFPGLCVNCSVTVWANGGHVRRGDSGWEVMCATCHRIDEQLAAADDFDEVEIDVPATPPSGYDAIIRLRVLGMVRECWRCGRDTTCLIGLYPQRPARGYCGIFTTDNESTMAVVQRLVRQHGRADLAVTVKDRYSATMGLRQLTNGCQHCDALQGNFPVQEEVLARVAAAGVDGLDTLLVAECSTPDWQGVVHDPGRGVIIV